MTLTLYPAIDLKDGNCVRLLRGEMDQATVFGTDPGAQAAAWQAAGFGWIHVVDLNGAFAGRTVNQEAVKGILSSVSVPVQLGGGLRDMAGIESWLEAGITRVILGSAAAKNPALVKEAAKAFPGRVAVGIDAKGGMVATEGWAETSDIAATDLARRFEDAGIAAIIYTDIARDGMKTGLNLDETTALAKAVSVPVIASGGVASVADIIALKAASAAQSNLNGSILGRALYDGSLNPKEALAAC
ncbi:1-(5-phosphoribosyl)-5-[(5-phosphoribosylamino)methylideneamino]imidazole-4-carboxamide isomerase [Acidocella aminolytica]|jgi:phosphoribosylformimino-5-aminoimidazole carboxamide ribotide isomerase|uniref:1-(5-phosphoribosyl)-5-[(5-phosphoribosylamino)methylideneamino] imidazole-4-carboxamide isomerase n=1 Tax=Acidocella aminolytica 101 = DSM 11237 TaxID=1120923 RepID=A0A0D6PC34_9PROT|nr:1-(5-phosphoribosyl)-5-[(5-phosphoribosylamino)methylideneamino]imidazole-4-carboxamide isomerase [Acidocella aminolytica]GAN79320.1 histidine biosynthesis HisA/His6, 1-(5-phosphoribosyl)-5-[(5-phosphoribosylamino) methylideneamino] imidazole-4-carboxamide isomerase [Acidocella aminolytica 101 = DSM 11237]GBQ39539.1 fusion protein [Acidocella aminolytica 101 = DSM 11237]SHE38297.1 1-(5-phosphoribosyl)-5-[(5-phosphoribosylamino)methylideneamino] imidazole-4-carboxamide isomerase [Acidocella am